jgi:hypothetical protein
MKKPEVRFVTAAEARAVLTEGGIRSEIAFQNDINTLLACLQEREPAMRALAAPVTAGRRLRSPRGSRLRRRGAADGGTELLAQDKVAVADGESEQLPERLVALRQLA